jgi:hypothetical protein
MPHTIIQDLRYSRQRLLRFKPPGTIALKTGCYRRL